MKMLTNELPYFYIGKAYGGCQTWCSGLCVKAAAGQ